MATVDEYLEKLGPAQRTELERVRKIIKQTVPSAEETISYGMPTYKINGKPLIYFAAFKNHMSLFGSVKPIEHKLSNFKLSERGTVQFTEANPIPDDLLKEILEVRLKMCSK